MFASRKFISTFVTTDQKALSMQVEIRTAVVEDMEVVLTLIQELAIFEKEPDAVMVTVEMLQKDYNQNCFKCLVAESAVAGIVGMALYYNRYSTWKGKTIHLEDLIVAQQYRSLGIGKQLLDGVIAEGKAQRLNRVEWAVLDWNTNAIAFYEKVGAQLLKDWYVVQLDADGIKNYK